MRIEHSKGFTLVEVLAVIVILAVLGSIAIPGVLSSINTSKLVSEKKLIDNIKTASQELYQEVEFMGSDSSLYDYDLDGNKESKITISSNSITVHLQALLLNGFLRGVGEEDEKLIVNPKTGENIGNCKIKISKIVSGDYETTYSISKADTDSKCPSY